MPNWTENKITVTGDAGDIRDFLHSVRSKESDFDFENLIPMPEILNHTACGIHYFDGKMCKSWYTVDIDRLFDTDDRPFTYEEELELSAIGHNSWYSWCVENWGTKWNAKIPKIHSMGIETEVEITFDTASSAPIPIFNKLHEMFPKLTFLFEWSNEGDDYEEKFSLVLEATD